MPLPPPIIEVLAAFRPLFTAPTWRKLMILLTGALLAHGRRTVAAALRHTGNERETNFSTFNQVLNRARWSPLAVSSCIEKIGMDSPEARSACIEILSNQMEAF